jgi:hypothetical protein
MSSILNKYALIKNIAYTSGRFVPKSSSKIILGKKIPINGEIEDTTVYAPKDQNTCWLNLHAPFIT